MRIFAQSGLVDDKLKKKTNHLYVVESYRPILYGQETFRVLVGLSRESKYRRWEGNKPVISEISSNLLDATPRRAKSFVSAYRRIRYVCRNASAGGQSSHLPS